MTVATAGLRQLGSLSPYSSKLIYKMTVFPFAITISLLSFLYCHVIALCWWFSHSLLIVNVIVLDSLARFFPPPLDISVSIHNTCFYSSETHLMPESSSSIQSILSISSAQPFLVF